MARGLSEEGHGQERSSPGYPRSRLHAEAGNGILEVRDLRLGEISELVKSPMAALAGTDRNTPASPGSRR
jgi:hypothetical protein